MDGYSDHQDQFGAGTASTEPHDDVTSAIGADERRMHVRAYNYWVSLLHDRDFPSIEDLDPGSITDFAPHSVLLDFTNGRDNPSTPYIGTAIRAECDLEDDVRSIEQVPSRSLLSRLTDHYLQIIANRAPIGFEAEFVNQRGHSICYRGILMPFSSDGDTIDFIYGVINWKDVDEDVEPAQTIAAVLPAEPEAGPGFAALDDAIPEPVPETPTSDSASAHISWEDGPLADGPPLVAADPIDEEFDEEPIVLADDAGLADRLCAARESAEVCKAADGRSRAALYRALAMAFDFAVAARRVPEEYAEILDDAGVKTQARAPMTPIVKLVFGVDYDKARLTEFAAALSYAERCQVDFGQFEDFLGRQDGGLKGMVAAERKARKPDAAPDRRAEKARIALRQCQPIALAEIDADEEFVLVLSRRRIGGGVGYEPIALVDDGKMVERAIRRASR
jgi:hypothetical protein